MFSLEKAMQEMQTIARKVGAMHHSSALTTQFAKNVNTF